ncbi:MAG TPA: hypothetical protein PK020_10370 [Ilumatobacteraceae bacterium]|nr:hypothetical protein [Ilumatobacteraceae bacterium]HRB02527.1 hypothetical protein [Ilumatobacteraceae bacterium]
MNSVAGDGRRLSRSRWAAIGAAVAVALGGGGIFVANATSSVSSSIVTIDPTRILDTRTDVGLPGPFVSAVSQRLQVTGGAVPVGATGVLLNVTVVNPTADGFLSVRPGDATGAPTTSSLNFKAGDLIPNSVQVGLPTSGAKAGQIDITYDAYGVAGPTTEVLIDVVGYMVAGGADPGPAGMIFIQDFNFTATTSLGTDDPVVSAPAGYSASVNLAAGRYYVTGDMTISNEDSSHAGVVFCSSYVNNAKQSTYSAQSIPAAPNGYGNLTISNTFTLPAAGTTIVDFRCFKTGNGGVAPTDMTYYFANMTIYKVG